MEILGYALTPPFIISVILHVGALWFLYINRVDLLYDNEDGNIETPHTLSLGRCWSWLLFYLAFSYWFRFMLGVIPPTTPFPPGLQEMLYACMIYEFAKKGVHLGDVLLKKKSQHHHDSERE